MLNCLHPEAAAEALEKESLRSPETLSRVKAFQGNTSSKSPEDLDGLEYLDSQDPESFAVLMHHLRSKFGIRILGGCCGTDQQHIREIARQFKPN
jgi:homocysteine S-methyltransferase